jgi:hypothetical protein
MKRSITNSFDSNIQNTSSYIVGPNFYYTGGTYEFTANNKFIKIISYSNTNDTLKIYHSYDSAGSTIISLDEFYLNDESRVFLLEVRSNFYKVEIISTDINNTRKRIYNSYLVSDDISTKIYGSGGKEIMCNPSGNLIVEISAGNVDISGGVVSKLQDGSGNPIYSSSHALNVYNTRYYLPTTDSIKSYTVDGSGNNINSTSNALNVYNSTLDNIYTLLNTRGTATLFNSSSSEFSSSVNFTNLNIKSITIYGSCSSGTTIIIQCSNDGTIWYSSQYTIVMTSANSFGFGISGFCPRYLRLQNQDLVTVTAYIDYC